MKTLSLFLLLSSCVLIFADVVGPFEGSCLGDTRPDSGESDGTSGRPADQPDPPATSS